MSLHEERDDQTQTVASALSSCVSLKSIDSMREPPVLSDGTVTSDTKSLILERKAGGTATISVYEERDDQTQTAASAVSLKSTDSMREPPVLSDGTVTSDPK
ncbi:hypothetical protein cypCar_00034643 [Cyprinus carpio]|nr:hypothetical protein cypCar_00034643 [Cyprinus carpio]